MVSAQHSGEHTGGCPVDMRRVRVLSAGACHEVGKQMSAVKRVLLILAGVGIALVVANMSTFVFLVWSLSGAVIGMVAAHRGGFSLGRGFVEGFALGWFAFLLFGAIVTEAEAVRRRCPQCAEWVKVEARVCKHCGHAVQPPTDVSRSGKCRNCSSAVAVRASECPSCGSPVRTDHRNTPRALVLS